LHTYLDYTKIHKHKLPTIDSSTSPDPNDFRKETLNWSL